MRLNIGENIKRLRRERDITQEQLASILRIEDLRKHDNIPDTYLKIGIYRRCDEWNSTTEIMIDTVSHRV